ncbi:predicted protein [Postia placenta Mad-698-R]|nr:predicted protein [Postia placenta Mad-698-R]
MTGPNLYLDSSVGCFLTGLMLSAMLYITSSITAKTSGFSKRWLLDTIVVVVDVQTVWELLVKNHASPLTLFPLASVLRESLIITDSVDASAFCKSRSSSLVCQFTHGHPAENQ